MSDESNTTVIDFSKKKAERDYQKALDEVQEKLAQAFDQQHEDLVIEELAFLSIGHIVDQMRMFDFDVDDNPETINDIIVLIQILKGMLYRSKNKKFKYHKLTDEICQDVNNKQKELQTFQDVFYSFGLSDE